MYQTVLYIIVSTYKIPCRNKYDILWSDWFSPFLTVAKNRFIVTRWSHVENLGTRIFFPDCPTENIE